MEKKEILQLISKYNLLSIIGMDKNVGKTTLLNYILKEARGKFPLGLTSIGRDGEEEDRVTATEKPRIYVEKGTYIATAKQCLFNGDITREIIKTTGVNTAMGEVIIVKALSDGYVELGGPSINAYMVGICRDLREIGSRMVIVDGALSRKTSASPSITEATILSTGAALSRSMDKVVEKTAHAIKILSLEREVDKDICTLSEQLFHGARVGIIFDNENAKTLEVLTSLEAAKGIVHCLDEMPKYVAIKGIISDKLIEDIMKSTDKYKGVTFLAEDGTKVFLNAETLYKFERQGGKLKVINPINIICVSANPKSPYGYEFDKGKFVEKLKKNIDLPIFDVVGGE